MKKNRLRYSFLLTFLAVLMFLTMSVSTQAAGVKTPGKVTITRVRLAGSSKVTVCWKKAKMLQTTGFIISRLVPDPGKELQL